MATLWIVIFGCILIQWCGVVSFVQRQYVKRTVHYHVATFEVSNDSWIENSIMPWQSSLLRNDSILIVDGDNLRGKTKFAVSKKKMFQDLQQFIVQKHIASKVILFFDHGMVEDALSLMPTLDFEISFSGPGKTADDAISALILPLQRKYSKDIVLVTEDAGLRKRCRLQSTDSRRNRKLAKQIEDTETVLSNKHKLYIVTSPSFARVLYDLKPDDSSIAADNRRLEPASTEEGKSKGSFVNLSLRPVKDRLHGLDPETYAKLETMKGEINLLIQLQNTQQKIKREVSLKGMKRAKKESPSLIGRYKSLAEQLRQLTALNEIDPNDVESLNESVVYSIVSQASKCLESVRASGCVLGIEETWQRVILAEELRLALRGSVVEQTVL